MPIARSKQVKTIGRGAITILSGGNETVTIAAVNTAKTELRYLGQTLETVDDATYSAKLYLTNSTTITASRINTGSDNTYLSYEYTEYY